MASGVLQYGFKGQRIESCSSTASRRVSCGRIPRSSRCLSAIFDDQAVPCQTLNFIHGSQQGFIRT